MLVSERISLLSKGNVPGEVGEVQAMTEWQCKVAKSTGFGVKPLQI